MCANSLLAAVTLAAQAHVNVELPIGRGETKPVSLYFITIGQSGERKSATNSQVMSSIKAREKELNLMLKAEVAAHEDELEVWQAERTKILRNKEADNAKKRAQLAAVGPKPKPPLKPILLLEEPTIEGLAKLLLVGQPSIGVFSPEGGEFVGGHAMKDDAKLRSAAGLSKLWDGEVWKRVRATDGAHTIAHKRVSLHLMLQPAIGDALISDAVLRDQGLVSRLLVTFPHTSMGTRLHRTPSDGAIKAVAAFNDLMAERIARRFSLQSKSQNDLAPRVLKFSTDAIKSWYAFGDKIEKNLGPDGELELISGFAGKNSPPDAVKRDCPLRVSSKRRHRSRGASAQLPRTDVSVDRRDVCDGPEAAIPTSSSANR